MKKHSLFYLLTAVLLLLSLSAIVIKQVKTPSDRVSGKARWETATEEGDLVFFAFDDNSIPWRDNLKLTLERPKKHPANPIIQPGPPGTPDSLSASLYGTVLKIGDKFRMWYAAFPLPDRRFKELSQYSPVAYAESTDGIHWEKPRLGLSEFRGNKDNNLVLIDHGSEEFGTPWNNFLSVIYDTEDPDPARRYKMAYNTRTPRGDTTTATAVSPDGLRWRLVNKTDFTRGHFETNSLIRFRGTYYLYGQNLYPFGGHLFDGTPAGRTMTVLSSPDFEHWSSGRALSFFRSNYEPKPMNYGREVHMGAGMWNRGNVIVGLYARWHGDTIRNQKQDFARTPSSQWSLAGLKMDLGLLLSNDGIHYREPVRDFVIVPFGKEGEWDSQSLMQGNAFYNNETETYIWYSHWDTNIPILPPSQQTPRVKSQGIGLVTMRRDGFGYLSRLLMEPVETWREKWERSEASLVTRSIRLRHPSSLYLNVAEVTPANPLRVDLVDEAERPLVGYEAVPVNENSLKARIQWQGNKVIPESITFRIRISWPPGVKANPKLYAIYLEKE